MSDYPDCGDYFSKFASCLSPKSQMYHYYATGDTEHCPVFVKDFMKCVEAQTVKETDQKRALMESTELVKRSKMQNGILTLKDTPSWQSE